MSLFWKGCAFWLVICLLGVSIIWYHCQAQEIEVDLWTEGDYYIANDGKLPQSVSLSGIYISFEKFKEKFTNESYAIIFSRPGNIYYQGNEENVSYIFKQEYSSRVFTSNIQLELSEGSKAKWIFTIDDSDWLGCVIVLFVEIVITGLISFVIFYHIDERNRKRKCSPNRSFSK